MKSDENKKRQTVFKEDEDFIPYTSIGLRQNLVAMLSYFLALITGVLFLLLERRNSFVKYHALQSIILTIPLTILFFALSMIPYAIFLLIPIYLTLWIFLMWKAYLNQKTKIPAISDLVENILERNRR